VKDRFHDLGVSRNFLLVPCGEFLDFETSEHLLNLSVGQLAPLDARRGADTLNGGHPPKGVQPVWGDGPQRPPGTFEFIDFREKLQEIAVIWMVSIASIPNFMLDYTGFVYRKRHRIIPDYGERP